LARARNIKPGLFKNEVLGVADPLFTLLFEGLWLLADREGRLENRPLRIKAEIFPYREGIDMSVMLGWLDGNGFIRRYQCGGLALIQIENFAKHQNPHKNEPESSLPAPSDSVEVPKKSEALGLIPDSGSLIPDSGLSVVPTPAAPAPPSKRKKPKTDLPEDFAISERVRAWAQREGFGQLEQHLEAFKRKVEANGYQKVNWDASFMEAIREDWAKLRGRTPTGAAPGPEQSQTPWHQTGGGIKAKGLEIGVPYTPQDDCRPFHEYKAKVFEAAGIKEAA